jgi:recombination protein RecR
MKNLDCINALINCFTRLPGVGYKTAERFAYKIVDADNSFVSEFCTSLKNVKDSVKLCEVCGNFTDSAERCDICKRRVGLGSVCVVKDPKDVIAIEKSGAHKGTYHVLHGVISPLDKKGPDDLNLKTLMKRLREEEIKEVIIATNPDIEGEATANYIAALVKPQGIKVTRIAQGLALGTNLEYADEVTLGAAINNRTAL